VADVVLVGLPGSGKTTTGRALAQTLGRAFIDTDDVFFEREHVSVQDYLRAHDEGTFREHEFAALRYALSHDGVVATGGGVVSTEGARRLLSSELTVWLDCPDDVLVARVLDGDRPLLAEEPAARLAEMRERRGGLYAEVSRFRVDSNRPIDQLLGELLSIVESAQAPS
jgi:shikimate kinase